MEQGLETTKSRNKAAVKYRYYFLVAIWCMVIFGCGHVVVKEAISPIDNKHIIGYPNFVRGESNRLFYALYWDSELPKDTFYLKVLTYKNLNLLQGKSLDIYIGKNKYSYAILGDKAVERSSSVRRDAWTGRVTGSTESEKVELVYPISIKFLDILAKTDKFGMRLRGDNGSEIEDQFITYNGITRFKAFIENIPASK